VIGPGGVLNGSFTKTMVQSNTSPARQSRNQAANILEEDEWNLFLC
jgi:hypothetical protein